MANQDVDIKRLVKGKYNQAQSRDWKTLETIMNGLVTAVGVGGDPTGAVALMNELRTDHATFKTAADGVETLIEELAADHATFKTVVDDLKVLVNLIQAQVSNRLQATGTLLQSGGTPADFKTTAIARATVAGVSFTKAATDPIAFSAAHVIGSGAGTRYGVILVQINAAGTVSTKVPLATQEYTTAALALDVLPNPDAGNVALGYITISTTSTNFTCNTTALATAGVYTVAIIDALPLGVVSQRSIPTAVSTSSPATLGSANPASAPATISAAAVDTGFAGAAVDTVTFSTNLS
jgi:hypothetical protein